ncbi:hypothetical protein [Hymenobacter nivis]|uniref:hypothetical protein n=1 Tax=Hymenobacter nivis TaxID=1850093 RepID=UPI0013A57E98|nr:hypothetical protein [Hymenobacter nivis]
MKTFTFTFLLFSVTYLTGFAQQSLYPRGKKIKDQALYLSMDATDNTLSYFLTGKTSDNPIPIKDGIIFSLAGDNSCSIYMKWLNPLKYKVLWKDTTFTDDRDKALSDFVGLLTSQFGTPVTSLNSAETKSIVKGSRAALLAAGTTELSIPANGFNNTALTLLYLQLRASQDLLTESDRINFNKITPLLENVDKKISTNIPKELEGIFEKLFALSDATNVASTTALESSNVDKFETQQTEIESTQIEIVKLITELKLSDVLLNSYTRTTVSNFIEQNSLIVNSNRNLIKNMRSVIAIINTSQKNESSYNTNQPETKGYYKIRPLSFEDGKRLQTKLTITEYEYKKTDASKERKELVKKSDVTKKTLVFETYDFVVVSVSTGIFYGNTTLRGFGVSNTGQGQFSITEDDIKSNTPITALFLNFNPGIRSRYFVPIAQIGLDPTKKRPFILYGGGFAFPSKKFAITAGGILAWEQSLNKLAVGQTISSTTELEKDIKYTFNLKTKGAYVGIQYNF